MKNSKRVNKSKVEQNNQSTSQGVAVVEVKPVPDPKNLAQVAEKEQRIFAARDYIETISILRDKKSFSFRQIAAWLNERGVDLDNNDVYRAYMASIQPIEKEFMKETASLPDPED